MAEYIEYHPLKFWLDPASIADIVAHIQTYLVNNPINSTTEIETIIHDYLIAHPELIGGVESVNGQTGEVVLTADNISAGENVTIADVLDSLQNQIDDIINDVSDLKNAFGVTNYKFSKPSGNGGEITKIYPIYGHFYKIIGSDFEKCNKFDFYEFYTDNTNARIHRIDVAELTETSVEFIYTPTKTNVDYLRIYMAIISPTPSEPATCNVIVIDLNTSAEDFTLSKEFATVRKFTAIGDSLTDGYYKESDSGTAYPDNLQYSWPQIMARIYGQTAVNAAHSGSTCASWWIDSHGDCKAKVTNGTRSQVYIMALGTNDYKDIADSDITPAQIGSSADIDPTDFNNNADSFWGNYCKILQYIHSVAPSAKIICCTIPQPRADTEWKQNAIREICAYSLFTNYVVLCDLKKWFNYLSDSRAMQSEMWQGHFTPVGYSNSAQFLMYAFSKTIQAHLEMFVNLPQIPYDTGICPVYSNKITKVTIVNTTATNRWAGIFMVNGSSVDAQAAWLIMGYGSGGGRFSITPLKESAFLSISVSGAVISISSTLSVNPRLFIHWIEETEITFSTSE